MDVKVSNLFQGKAWIKTFLLKTLINKSVKHGVTFLVGFLTGPLFMVQIHPLLQQMGIDIDVPTLTTSLMAANAGITGWLMNWAMKVLDKDGDGIVG